MLIGGLAIHIGAKFAFASRDYSDAVFTALIGAVAWTIVDIAFASIGIGGLLASAGSEQVSLRSVRGSRRCSSSGLATSMQSASRESEHAPHSFYRGTRTQGYD